MKHCIPRNILLAALALAMLTAAGGAAASPMQQPQVQAAAVSQTITYQGQLSDAGGNPLNGSYTFLFELYGAASGGSRLWQQTKSGVQVRDGLFAVALNVDAAGFDGRALWLAITVNGQLLSPRQELTPAPYALSLRPGARVYGNLAEPALDVSNEAGTGVQGVSANDHGVYGETEDDTESGAAGVAGYSTHEGTFGVHGSSESGIGVQGRIDNPANSNPAVVGVNFGAGAGVEGYSENDGVIGQSLSAGNYGGRFFNSADGGSGLKAEGGGAWSPDLVLGGSTGTIYSEGPRSEIKLYSMSNVTVDLDDNDDGEAQFSIWNGANEGVFWVDEHEGTFVRSELYVGSHIDSRGLACMQFDVPGSGLHAVDVPGFCLDALCWITLLSDGTFGAQAPGLSWPSMYMQRWDDDSWVAGPNINIAGLSIGGGPGVNGDGRYTGFGFGGETAGGGVLRLLDDSAVENDWDLWTIEFRPKAGELSYATLYVCPMGVPTPSSWGGDQ